MSTIEIDSEQVELGTMFQVSVNYSFDPLKQAVVYIMQHLKENSESINLIKGQLGISKYGICLMR